jgi:hypothetical protein
MTLASAGRAPGPGPLRMTQTATPYRKGSAQCRGIGSRTWPGRAGATPSRSPTSATAPSTASGSDAPTPSARWPGADAPGAAGAKGRAAGGRPARSPGIAGAAAGDVAALTSRSTGTGRGPGAGTARRDLPLVEEPVAEPVGCVAVADAGGRVGEAERAAVAGGAERGVAGAAERHVRGGLQVAEGEAVRRPQEDVERPAARHAGGRGERLQGRGVQSELAREGGAVRGGDGSGCPDAVRGRQFHREHLGCVEGRVHHQLRRVAARPAGDAARPQHGEQRGGRVLPQVQQHLQAAPPVDGRPPFEDAVRRVADREVEPQRYGDLLGEEAPQRPAGRVDPAQQLALVPAEAHAVVAVARPGLPQRTLARYRVGQTVEVGEQVRVEWLVHDRQAGLVRKELAHGHVALPRLRELGPVRRHALVIVEPAARVGQRERHRGEPLRGRVDEHERVLAPGLAVAGVAHASPQVDHLLAAHVGGAGAAELVAHGEVALELVADLFEARFDVPLDHAGNPIRRI